MKKVNILLLVALLQTFVVSSTKGQDSTKCDGFCCCRPDALAPAGIMVDHVHEKGKFGIAYGYMNMAMQGNQSGTSSVSNTAVWTNYTVAPAKMNMQMHMLMPMYGITNRLTVMAMINYNINTMTMDLSTPGSIFCAAACPQCRRPRCLNPMPNLCPEGGRYGPSRSLRHNHTKNPLKAELAFGICRGPPCAGCCRRPA